MQSNDKLNVLLVEPNFPNPNKNKYRKNSLPIGLLKLGSLYRKQGYEVRLKNPAQEIKDFTPDLVLVTSSFTYWYKYVWEAVKENKEQFPTAKVIVGGIYASLMPEHCKKSGCDEVYVGINEDAEKLSPAYDLLEVAPKYQIIHTSRGCLRKCSYCGVWKIEPKLICKQSVKDEIITDHIVFYDNNLLANPFVEKILRELIEIRKKRRNFRCESQCGIDARLLTKEKAVLLKDAGFINMRLAWDWNYEDSEKIENSLKMLYAAGFRRKDTYIFMIYNWEIPYLEMEKKRLKCWEWQVQIADCRFRKLDQTCDYYNPLKIQTAQDYFIHPNWNDQQIKDFRKHVRRQNICVRHGFPFYSRALEHKRIAKETAQKVSKLPINNIKELIEDAWFPQEILS